MSNESVDVKLEEIYQDVMKLTVEELFSELVNMGTTKTYSSGLVLLDDIVDNLIEYKADQEVWQENG